MPQTIRKGDREDDDDIVDAEIVDLEKRKDLRKYYVYVIEVSVKCGPKHIVYRRYNQFHNLNHVLEERYPIESGHIDAKDRTLPALPGKKYLGRSAVRDVAEERISQLSVYMKKLIASGKKISRDEFVQRFFRQTEHDGKPYTGAFPYRGQSAPASSFTSGARPPPPNKKLPGPPPRPLSGPPKRPVKGPSLPSKRPDVCPAVKPRGVAVRLKPPVAKKPVTGPRARGLYEFSARNPGELSFKKGDIIKLRQRIGDGWLEGQLNSHKGLVPVTYVEIIEDLLLEHSDTDEWDDDEDEEQHDSGPTGTVLCVYKGKERVIQVSQKVLSKPSYSLLIAAVKSRLGDSDITLNYRDSQGDLVLVADDEDTRLLVTEGVPKKPGPKVPNRVQWQLHVTRSGDLSVYNVKPRKPKAIKRGQAE